MTACVVALAILTLVAQPAFAQSRGKDRLRVSINAGAQFGAPWVDERIAGTVNLEAAPLMATLNDILPLIDGGVAVQATPTLSAQLSISHTSGTGNSRIAMMVPHPFFFDQPRIVFGRTPVRRSETAVHTDVVYAIVSGRTDVALSGGLSVFSADEDIVTGIAYQEQYPYSVATFSSAVVARFHAVKVGYNAAVDVSWKQSPRWGFGGLFRFCRARAPLTIDDRSAGSVILGGVQATGGLRFMF